MVLRNRENISLRIKCIITNYGQYGHKGVSLCFSMGKRNRRVYQNKYKGCLNLKYC